MVTEPLVIIFNPCLQDASSARVLRLKLRASHVVG